MKTNIKFLYLILAALTLFNLGMANRGQYDEEAREAERQEKQERKAAARGEKHPVQNFAGGVKQATYDSTRDLLSDTAESTVEEAPVVGTLEGARKGTAKVLDNTVKGAVKVATLGYGSVDNYEVQEPESGTGEPTKIKIKIPGT